MTTNHDNLIPLNIRYSDPTTKAAWEILDRAQRAANALSIARAAADYGGYLAPETPGEYLYWIHDQARVQQGIADQGGDLQAMLSTSRFAGVLRHAVLDLTKLGIEEEAPTPANKGRGGTACE